MKKLKASDPALRPVSELVKDLPKRPSPSTIYRWIPAISPEHFKLLRNLIAEKQAMFAAEAAAAKAAEAEAAVGT
jgi:hypothetical protein